jgi:sugar phosphate isomerase/epimerase
MDENITIALTAKWPSYPTRLAWIYEHGFALEYAPDPEHLELLHRQIDPYLSLGQAIRYHGFLPGYEIGHQDPAEAEKGLAVHKQVLDQIHGKGEQVLTVHIGLDPQMPIDPDMAIRNLGNLVDYGNSLGITVCLENLRRGITSNPQTVADWAKETGAMITFDIGHAVSCARVQNGTLTALTFLETLSSRLYEVHLYGSESDRHYPPKGIEAIRDLLDRCLDTDCVWWTIELDDYNEALYTRDLVLKYLEEVAK